MLCAISGEAPEVPVASRKSGAVFEKRLIQAYIAENGTDPTTNEALTTDDLIDLKTSRIVRPRPPALTSIPSLLSVFQEEWDALALEAFTLKQNLAKTRQELSTTLYQHDAAVRIIARLTKERDEARAALSNVDVSKMPSSGDFMQLDTPPLSADVIAKVENTQERLSKGRRKRPVPDDWATPEEISSYAPIGSSDALYVGGRTLALHDGGDMVLVGGSDSVAGCYSLSQRKVLYAMKSDGSPITGGLWAGTKAVFSTAAGRVKVFEGSAEVATFAVHAGPVSAVALHPSGDILASVGRDKSYALYDLETNETLTRVHTNSSLTCAQFHPDGHLLAAGGTDGQIKIFEVKSGTEAAAFDLGAPLDAVFFSENGIWLAAVTQGSSVVSIWDLRKATEVQSIDIGGTVDCISWDYTGQYLLTGGPNGITVQHYSKGTKDWSEPLRFAVPATGVTWGASAQSVLAVDESGIIHIIGA